MTTQQRLTKERLEKDIGDIIVRLSAERTHAGSGNQNTGRVIYDEKYAITCAVLDGLRRNWTVTERARSQRTVPGA